jgi:hypothetical protein
MKVACPPAVLVSFGLLSGAGCSTSAASDGGQDAGPQDAGTDAGSMDAGPDAGPDLTCLGLPLPTTAPATLMLGGTVGTTSLAGTSPVSGATVAIFSADAGGAAIATATTDANGAFSLSISSGGAPFDGYLEVTAPTYTPTYWYPAVPFAANTSTLPVQLLTPATIGTIRTISGAAQPPDSGMAGIEVVDCAGVPLSGASVTTNPAAGSTVYVIANYPSSSATSTDSSGAAFLFDLTPGNLTIGATLGSTQLRSHDVNARPDVVTETSVRP